MTSHDDFLERTVGDFLPIAREDQKVRSGYAKSGVPRDLEAFPGTVLLEESSLLRGSCWERVVLRGDGVHALARRECRLHPRPRNFANVIPVIVPLITLADELNQALLTLIYHRVGRSVSRHSFRYT